MDVQMYADRQRMAAAAARVGAAAIGQAIAGRGEATVVLATGMSQFEMLEHLVALPIDWSRVTVFHLDEYVGISPDHGASFRRYLRERFVARVSGLKEFVAIDGDAGDLDAELARLNGALGGREVDVCFAGIGENCHLAFNDPPADFEASDPFIVVRLDEACRRQQLGEGWFPSLEAVPERAISMSIRQIMAARALVISVPDERKAEAVRHALEGPVSPQWPASILQRHDNCHLFLDPPAASLLANPPALIDG
ncbi:glucosamine-6-phosphate deaminase [Marinimicrococcus flavescens]|uniref:Glucosamine-6-phosphate deaminase n=1 Tax=Marinimicrococcus flavescens TaxID=3031815 RepID=A0AAP3XSX9_9PROT|nr:glucosamine-6-phosphate deaminase [Marinimicrococcus flavescens]